MLGPAPFLGPEDRSSLWVQANPLFGSSLYLLGPSSGRCQRTNHACRVWESFLLCSLYLEDVLIMHLNSIIRVKWPKELCEFPVKENNNIKWRCGLRGWGDNKVMSLANSGKIRLTPISLRISTKSLVLQLQLSSLYASKLGLMQSVPLSSN